MGLKYFVRNEHYQIIWLHGSHEVISEVIKSVDRRTYVIITFSWHAFPATIKKIFTDIMVTLGSISPLYVTSKNFLFLFNSLAEYESAQRIYNDFNIEFVNEACFVNVTMFDIIESVTKKYDVVCNSRAAIYKRHFLSRMVENKIFITYGTAAITSVNIDEFNPLCTFKSIPYYKVCLLLNKSRIGLILSKIEGVCNASLEYLLCGLPVVSTDSIGGRDEYYTPANSIIAADDPDAVAAAVAEMLRRLHAGDIDPMAIRAGALRRIEEFRGNFLNALAALLAAEPDRDDVIARVIDLLGSDKKLSSIRNKYLTLETLPR